MKKYILGGLSAILLFAIASCSSGIAQSFTPGEWHNETRTVSCYYYGTLSCVYHGTP